MRVPSSRLANNISGDVKRSSVARSGRPTALISSGQKRTPCNITSCTSRPSLVRYRLTSGFGRLSRVIFGGACPNSFDMTMSGELTHIPNASSDTSTTAASPVRSRCNSAAAIDPAIVRPLGRSPNAAGCVGPYGSSPYFSVFITPERAKNDDDVIRALVGVRTFCALAMAAHVDDVRVDGANVLDVEVRPLAGTRQPVGEEHVCGLAKLVEGVESGRVLKIDRHRLLAVVRLLDEVVDAAGRVWDEPGGDEATLRVTAVGMLDLEHLGTPLGEHRAGGGHERPCRYLDNADPLHRLHRSLPARCRARRAACAGGDGCGSGLTGGEAGDEALARAAEPVARESRHEDALVPAERRRAPGRSRRRRTRALPVPARWRRQRGRGDRPRRRRRRRRGRRATAPSSARAAARVSACSDSSGAVVLKIWNGGDSMVAVAFSGISHASRSAMTP